MYCLNKYRFNENDFLAFLEFTDPIYEENRLIFMSCTHTSILITIDIVLNQIQYAQLSQYITLSLFFLKKKIMNSSKKKKKSYLFVYLILFLGLFNCRLFPNKARKIISPSGWRSCVC